MSPDRSPPYVIVFDQVSGRVREESLVNVYIYRTYFQFPNTLSLEVTSKNITKPLCRGIEIAMTEKR